MKIIGKADLKIAESFCKILKIDSNHFDTIFLLATYVAYKKKSNRI